MKQHIRKYFSPGQVDILEKYFSSGPGVKNMSGLNVWLSSYTKDVDTVRPLATHSFFDTLDAWNKRREEPFSDSAIERLKRRVHMEFNRVIVVFENVDEITINKVRSKLPENPEEIRCPNVGDTTIRLYEEFLRYLKEYEL